MYAIIETGGKQVQAVPGEQLKVERLEAAVGDTVSFDKVMLVKRDGKIEFGSPFVKGTTVTATVTEQGRDSKILVFKMKRRKGYRRTRGHRQAFTAVRIDSIERAKA